MRIILSLVTLTALLTTTYTRKHTFLSVKQATAKFLEKFYQPYSEKSGCEGSKRLTFPIQKHITSIEFTLGQRYTGRYDEHTQHHILHLRQKQWWRSSREALSFPASHENTETSLIQQLKICSFETTIGSNSRVTHVHARRGLASDWDWGRARSASERIRASAMRESANP